VIQHERLSQENTRSRKCESAFHEAARKAVDSASCSYQQEEVEKPGSGFTGNAVK
jgi:hypothetical protein